MPEKVQMVHGLSHRWKLRKMKYLIYFALTIMLGFSFTAGVRAQALDKAMAKQLVESKKFVFKVQTVMPTGASNIQVTSEYDIKLNGDSLTSYLPYFGRAYSAPEYGQSGGLNFTSTEFEYSTSSKKKGGWNITIKPSDTRDVRQLYLSIGETGYASLQVISNNRQPISYYGYIAAK
jgi:hypothetical protein